MAKTIWDHIVNLRYDEEMTWRELLTKMADEALARGWAKEGFTEALLAREEMYATGLHAAVDLAIPHTDAEFTAEPALITAVLGEPVAFEPMGGEGGPVAARFVFLLVLPDAEAHIDFLQALSDFISDEELMNRFAETEDMDFLIGCLKRNSQASASD